MATIPQVRDVLAMAAADLAPVAEEADDYPPIQHALAAMKWAIAQLPRRRFSGPRRASSVTVPCTPELREEIRDYAEAHPSLLQIEIAQKFAVNSGRVSESLHGFRR